LGYVVENKREKRKDMMIEEPREKNRKLGQIFSSDHRFNRKPRIKRKSKDQRKGGQKEAQSRKKTRANFTKCLVSGQESRSIKPDKL